MFLCIFIYYPKQENGIQINVKFQAILEALEYMIVNYGQPKRSFYIAFGHDEEVRPLINLDSAVSCLFRSLDFRPGRCTRDRQITAQPRSQPSGFCT